MTVEPDWGALEELLNQSKLAYYAHNDERFNALIYMLQLGVNDLKEARLGRPSKGGFVYPSRAAEVQAAPVREDRSTDRESDQARFQFTEYDS